MSGLISIIIPCYNAEQYIVNTVNSALNQSYSNIELIIIDDGSNDKSKEKIKSICEIDNRVKYIFQENKGVSAARNKGLDLAQGEFVAFLDSDDIWDRTKLEKQLSVINIGNVGACYCGYNIWYCDTNKFVKKKMKFTSENLLEKYVKEETAPQTSTWIIKRTIIEENNLRFNEECSWGEDIEFFIKIMALTNIESVDQYLVNYRIVEGSLTSKNSISYDDIVMWNRVKMWLKDNKIHNYGNLIKNIDRYRISRTYIDNFLKEIRFKKDYKIFYHEKMNAIDNIKLSTDLKDIKLFIKKIYILLNLFYN